jgi:hypothetical protein
MKTLGKLLMGVTMFGIMLSSVVALESKKFDFNNETLGAESKAFSAPVGDWRIDKDGSNLVYAVDGSKRAPRLSAGADGNAKDLYGEKSSEFLKGIEPLKHYTLTVLKEFPNFKNGTLTVSFKAISGKEDQAAGIAFNIRKNGEYLVIRANALENNLGLFRFERGKRLPLQWAQDVPPPEKGWHTLKVAIKKKKIEGYLDDKKYIDYTYEDSIDGRIGLWSKADSYVFFNNYAVQSE